MGQISKDPSLALHEIAELLSAYWESNSMENYITLLNGLEYVVLELKGDIRQGKQLERKKYNELQFSRGPTNVPMQDFPNVVTRSHKPVSMDALSSLTLRSDLKPEPFVSEGANQQCIPVVQPSGYDSRSEVTRVGRESFTSGDNAGPATIDPGMTIRDKLKEEIERCGDYYRGNYFIVNGNEHSETVNPDEIDRFFSRFQEGEWLTNFNLMPLLFSFDWPSTTLVLHSFYTSIATLKDGNRHHWTLFEVDLQSNVIRQYDSLTGDVSKSADVVSAIKVRLAHAMVGWESQNRDFATVGGASQQQENDSDCRMYMIYNADCLASNRDTLAEQIDGVQLRYRYLERLLDIERRGRSERQIVNMVMSPNKKLRIKRRHVPED
ncbi:MAG: hypothetical protein Q9163_001672 [Psora crenata]